MFFFKRLKCFLEKSTRSAVIPFQSMIGLNDRSELVDFRNSRSFFVGSVEKVTKGIIQLYCTSDLYIYILFAIAYEYGKILLLILFHDHTHTNSETATTLLLESTTCLVVYYRIYCHGIVHLFFWFLSTHVFFIFK